MTAIILKFFLSDNGKKTVKAVGIVSVAFFLLIASILANFISATTEGGVDNYKTAIREVMRTHKVKTSQISPSVIRAVDLIIYQDVLTRQKEQIVNDIEAYYMRVDVVEKEMCSMYENDDGSWYEECEIIQVETLNFKKLEEILQTLKHEKELSDASIEDIRLVIELAKAGGYYEDELRTGVPIPTTGGYILPTESGTITCGFGCYPNHIGTDIGSYSGTVIMSVADGVVLETENGCLEGYDSCGSGYGNNVKVAYNIDGVSIVIVYAHMLQGSVVVETDEQVTQGQQLGSMGNTGMSYGTHLHFEMLVGISYFPINKEERKKYVVDTEDVFEYPDTW